MVAAIRQTIKVEQDGRIEIRSPQLQTGATAEVIVLLDSRQGRSPLVLLDNLQRIMGLDYASAQAWAYQSRAERISSTRHIGAKPE
jgi:hypothetical protein